MGSAASHAEPAEGARCGGTSLLRRPSYQALEEDLPFPVREARHGPLAAKIAATGKVPEAQHGDLTVTRRGSSFSPSAAPKSPSLKRLSKYDTGSLKAFSHDYQPSAWPSGGSAVLTSPRVPASAASCSAGWPGAYTEALCLRLQRLPSTTLSGGGGALAGLPGGLVDLDSEQDIVSARGSNTCSNSGSGSSGSGTMSVAALCGADSCASALISLSPASSLGYSGGLPMASPRGKRVGFKPEWALEQVLC